MKASMKEKPVVLRRAEEIVCQITWGIINGRLNRKKQKEVDDALLGVEDVLAKYV